MFKSKNPITLSIPKPCSENWQGMTPVEKGRFCASCQKKVYDFTAASDREIVNEFKKNNNLCGHFKVSQLDRELYVPKEKSSVWMVTTSALISFLALGTKEVYAQGSIKIEQTDKKTIGDSIQVGHGEITITGIVSDEQGPFPGVNVTLKGTTTGAQTDLDGKYSIKVRKNDTLTFSFIGMVTKEVTIKEIDNKTLNISMKEDSVSITTGVIIERYKKRTFFGRIFHSIRNWFR